MTVVLCKGRRRSHSASFPFRPGISSKHPWVKRGTSTLSQSGNLDAFEIFLREDVFFGLVVGSQAHVAGRLLVLCLFGLSFFLLDRHDSISNYSTRE